MKLTYRILITPEEQGFSVAVPALSGCFTKGDTIEEAIELAKEAVSLYIDSLVEDGERVPDDSKNFDYLITI